MYWEVAAGGSSWSQLHQLTLLNRPVQSHHAPTPQIYVIYVCTTTGGGIGLPGHVLAPNEGSYSNHFGNKVKRKSQLEVQQQTRMSHHHCCCTVEAVIMIKLLLLGPQFFTSQNCLLFFYNIRMISCKPKTRYGTASTAEGRNIRREIFNL